MKTNLNCVQSSINNKECNLHPIKGHLTLASAMLKNAYKVFGKSFSLTVLIKHDLSIEFNLILHTNLLNCLQTSKNSYYRHNNPNSGKHKEL